MKFIAFLSFVVSFQLQAKVHSQSFNFNETNTTVKQMFKEIEKNSQYSIFYRLDQVKLNQKINVIIKQGTIETVMNQVLQHQPLTFEIVDNVVVVKAASATDTFIQTMVRGRITDQKGEPLPGVVVKVKGTSAGTTSDAEGRYSINAPVNSTLVFTYLGYKTKEIAVNNQETLNVTLESSATSLDEVVVVGYGSQKKSDLTGSISSIKGSDLTLLPSQRVDQALQGRAAGVLVLNTTGTPGGNTTIRVRGMNSIGGGNDALVVIDGLQGGTLNSLNPEDIESIDVLKDASATAIYGSRGANGVILITTKSGKLGKPVISYTYDHSLSEVAKRMDLMSAAEYAENINAYRMAANGVNQPAPTPYFTQAQIDEFRRTGGTDWQDVIFQTATTQNHQLSVSGATDKTNYRVSTGYLDQEGIMLGSGYNRFTLRAVVGTEITKWLNFNINWAGTVEKNNNVTTGGAASSTNNPMNGALIFSPTIPVYDALGNYSRQATDYGPTAVWNPVANALEPIVLNNSVRNNLNTHLDIKPLPGLTLRISGSAIFGNFTNKSFYNTKTYAGLQAGNGTGNVGSSESQYYQNSNILTYDKTLNKHHLTFTGVAEQQYTISNGVSTNGTGFLSQETAIYNMSGASLITSSSSRSERVLNSYMGRINYIFNDRYLFTASYRADGSSVFGNNNKWGYFPSAAFAWRASEENFIKNLNIFSDLKLRATWGITGNQAIGAYNTLASISASLPYPYNGGSATQLGSVVGRAPNPNLKWESTEQIDLGADIGVLGGRLTLTADVYKKTTKDLLMGRDLPPYSGFTSFTDNVGSMENKGIELAISGDPVAGKNTSWHSGFNITWNRTTVLDLGTSNKLSYAAGGSGLGTNGAFMYLVEGESFGKMIGYGYEGVWKSSQAAAAAQYGQLPGDPHYTDRNMDGKINSLDTVKMGNTTPNFIFGWNNEVTHKNLSLFVQIQGSQGNDIFNATRVGLGLDATATGREYLNRWTPQNENSDNPGLIPQKTRDDAKLVSTVAFPAGNNRILSRYVEDGSYIRLKNITLAYNLPASVFNKFKRNNLKIYVSGTNLITLTKYTGYDPEVSSYTGNDAQLGSDYFNYPTSKTFNVGLNLTL